MMNTFLIKEIFKIYGGVSGLTEKVIYENQARNKEDNISVFSSATEKTFFLPKVDKNTKIKGKEIKIFSKEKKYIIVARNGKAGLMGIIENIDFTINDHAYIFEIKKNFINRIDLNYFILKYQKIFLDFVSSKDSNGTFSKEISENYEIELIDISLQKELVSSNSIRKNIVFFIKNKIKEINNKVNSEIIINKYITMNVEQIAILNKGSNQISEESIYHNYDVNGVPVYSSATINDGLMGKVSKEYYNNFRKKGNPEELTWTTNGYAGIVFYRQTNYLYSEKCGRIVLRKKFKDLINLKFLRIYLNQITYKYKTSESGNGKLDIIHMSNIPIKIPTDENGNIDIYFQNSVVTEYEKFENLKNKLNILLDNLTI